MTSDEQAELLRFGGGAGVVYLDTPEQRGLLRRNLIRIVESPPVIFKQVRSFAVITDAGTVAYLKILGKVGERVIARGHSGTLRESLRDKGKS
jgi:hypothetical protein